jgi:hypothetical protein
VEQPLGLSASGGGGDDKLVDAVRYSYEPDATLPNVRLSFACVNGRVADVSRTLIH